MNGYTVHLKPGEPPVLLKEGWSWGCFLFGPIWFAGQRVWVPAAVQLAIVIGVSLLAPPVVRGLLLLALAVLAGLMGRDVVRWALEQRGYLLAHVVAARDEDAALGRLLHARPDLATGMAGLLR